MQYSYIKFMMLYIVFTLLGCQDNLSEVNKPFPKLDESPPVVTSQIPSVNQKDVSDTTIILITFSESLNVNTVNNSSFSIVDENNEKIKGNLAYDDVTKSIRFTPDIPLNYFSNYKVTLTSTITDNNGNPLKNQSWSFLTIKQASWANLVKSKSAVWKSTFRFSDTTALDDGSLIITGSSRNNKYFTLKLSNRANVEWIKSNSNTRKFCITPDNHIISIGRYVESNAIAVGSQIVYSDAESNSIWIKSLGGESGSTTNSKNVVFEDIACPDVNSIVVVGYVESVDTGKHAIILKFTDTGNLVWHKTLESSGSNFLTRISTIDNAIVATGWYSGQNQTGGLIQNGWVIKFNLDGSVAWQKLFGTFEDFATSVSSIIATSDNNFVLTGKISHRLNDKTTSWISMIDSFGNVLWQRSLGDESQFINGISDVAISNGTPQEIYAIGFRFLNLPESPLSTIQILSKIDLSGNVVWQKSIFSSASKNIDFSKLNFLPDGGIFLSGSTQLYQNTAPLPEQYGILIKLDKDTAISSDTHFGLSLETFSQPTTEPAITLLNSTLFQIVTTDTIMNPKSPLAAQDVQLNLESITGPYDIHSKPSNLLVSQSTPGSLSLSWMDNSELESGYIVYRSEDNITFARIYETISGYPASQEIITHTDNNLTPNTTYYYKISAFSILGYSDYSNVAAGVPL